MSVQKGIAMTDQIYVALLGEGVNVWRPVPSRRIADRTYVIEQPPGYDPDDETWEFPPGSIVICEPRRTSEGEILAAVRLKESKRRIA
jgi:hypothetical protein